MTMREDRYDPDKEEVGLALIGLVCVVLTILWLYYIYKMKINRLSREGNNLYRLYNDMLSSKPKE